ncbi:hypothetical protein J2W42_003998 [Rhizobium tibeticum]|uniref:hypothetical protein n=1 Tax=Rhizobium tibeticum TaxID=501024 RepID=UPI00277DB6FA|nr:hypothetical protein [Rhizobium tibeticum]MDP9811135.1 hypothetical protein [Rhizobium tibeticum]
MRKAFGWVGLLEVPGLLAMGLIGNSIIILLGFWQRHAYGANLSNHDWFPAVQDIFDRASGGTRKASLEREPNLGRKYDRDSAGNGSGVAMVGGERSAVAASGAHRKVGKPCASPKTIMSGCSTKWFDKWQHAR